MHLDRGSQESPGIRSGQIDNTSAEASANQPYARAFKLSEQKLASTLDLLRSYQVVLQAGVNLARLFQVPLTSDLKASELGHLFDSLSPRVLEVEHGAHGTVHWADVVRGPKYAPERQDDGKYHVRLDKGNALVELSGRDHETVMTGMPRQLIDPYSYPSDVVSELNIVKLAMAQIAPWKDTASVHLRMSSFQLKVNPLIGANAVTETIGDVLGGMSERLRTLEAKSKALRSRGNPCRVSAGINQETPVPSKPTGTSQTTIRTKKRKGESRAIISC